MSDDGGLEEAVNTIRHTDSNSLRMYEVDPELNPPANAISARNIYIRTVMEMKSDGDLRKASERWAEADQLTPSTVPNLNEFKALQRQKKLKKREELEKRMQNVTLESLSDSENDDGDKDQDLDEEEEDHAEAVECPLCGYSGADVGEVQQHYEKEHE